MVILILKMIDGKSCRQYSAVGYTECLKQGAHVGRLGRAQCGD